MAEGMEGVWAMDSGNSGTALHGTSWYAGKDIFLIAEAILGRAFDNCS